MSDNEKTQIADKFSVTQIAADGATSIADGEEIKTLAEINAGEIVDGYTVGAMMNDKGGEAFIRFAVKDGKKFVIKIFKSGRSIDANSESVLAAINSPYVMPISARGEVKGLHYQILPYYKNGTYNGKKLSGGALRNFITQVNEGLHTIHGAKIFHGDIKPDNIFQSDDSGHAVIGDFGISKFAGQRTSVTNIGISRYYAAPEGDEIYTVESDYFSFGMTVLTVAYGETVFKEMSESAARRAILLGRIPMPEKEIGEDVCDLIYMLTKANPNERITYDGVREWLENPGCYRGCRTAITQSEESLQLTEGYTFVVNGKKEKFYDALKLAEAMNNDQKTALPHYSGDFIQGAINKSSDQTLALELQGIRKKYPADQTFGLFLTLHAINPNLKIKFNGIEMSDFKDYIDVLMKRYPKIDSHFADRAFIDVVLKHSDVTEKAAELIGKILDLFQKPVELYDMFLNLFGNTKEFFCNGEKYASFGEFLDREAFTENGNPRVFNWECFRKEFLSNFLPKFNADEKTVAIILNEKDKLTEYFSLGKLVNGHIPFRLVGKQVKNLYDFIDVLAYVKVKGSNTEKQSIVNFLEKGGFEIIESFEVTRQKELAACVKKASDKMSYIYFHCYKNAEFYGCKTVKELIEKMGKISKDSLDKVSEEILASEDFKIWMSAQGVKL